MSESALELNPAQPEVPGSVQVETRFPKWFLGALLVAATILAYQQVWHAGFIWDDDGHVTSQGLRSTEGLGRIWSEFGATQQYYPLAHSVFWVEHRIWGDAPAPYHWINILLHALSALLVARILERLKIPGAWLAAALFALHPVEVESVAWVSELKNTLSGVFYLGAVLAYLKFQNSNAKSFYGLSLMLFLLGLMSKTVVATLPAALLVIGWWQRGRLTWKGDVLPLTPFFGAGMGAGLLTAWVERRFVGAEGAEFHFTFIERCLIAGRDVIFYLGKLFWPVDLAFIYPRWQVSQSAWWQYLFPAAVLMLLGVLVWRKWRGTLAGLLFFMGTLFPALGFFNVFPFRYSFVADHFQYLASLGPLTLVAAGLSMVRKREFVWRLLCATLFVVLGTMTWRQCGMYVNNERLWETTLARDPNCWMARGNLGTIYFKRGQIDEAIRQYHEELRLHPNSPDCCTALGSALEQKGQLDGAMRQFQEAIRLKPDLAHAHRHLGFVLQKKGRIDEAISEYREAIRLLPDHPEAHYLLGMALDEKGQTDEAIQQCLAAVSLNSGYVEAHDKLGTMLDGMGRFDDAIKQYGEAIRLKPEDATTHYNLAGSLQRKGRMDEAISELREAIRLNPNYAQAHNNFGAVLERKGQLDEATSQYQEAARLQPESPEYHFNLGVVYGARGRFEDAIGEFERAIRLKPDFIQARNDLGIVLGRTGKLEEAIYQFREAIRLKPGDAESHINLAFTLSLQGKREEAAEHYRQALRINPDLPQAQNGLRALQGGSK